MVSYNTGAAMGVGIKAITLDRTYSEATSTLDSLWQVTLYWKLPLLKYFYREIYIVWYRLLEAVLVTKFTFVEAKVRIYDISEEYTLLLCLQIPIAG